MALVWHQKEYRQANKAAMSGIARGSSKGIFLRKIFIKVFAVFFYVLAIALLIAKGIELAT